MKKIQLAKTYGEFLNEKFQFENENVNEKKGDNYSKGCAMIYFDFPEMGKLHSMIEKEDLYTEEGDRSYGLEDEPHVTLLYGLNEGVTKEEVFETIKDIQVSNIVMNQVSAFKNKQFDVLKWDVEAEYLYEMNAGLTTLPHETDFPDYHPHATIAYLKPGTADKYIEIMKGMEYTVQPNSVVYSMPDGTKAKMDMKNVVSGNK